MIREIDYYGSEENQAISYLEFGSVNPRERSKKIWGYWQDQEAYDLYMFARYARDIFRFRHFLNSESPTIDSLKRVIEESAHIKLLDYIFKYAGVISQMSKSKNGGVCYVKAVAPCMGLLRKSSLVMQYFMQENTEILS